MSQAFREDISLNELFNNLACALFINNQCLKTLLDTQQKLSISDHENQLLNAKLQEKEQIEQFLGESEKRFRLLAENSTDMISCHTAEGKILYASPACKTLLNYEPKELIKKHFYRLFHYNDLDKIKQLQQAIDNHLNTITLSYRIKHKDGHHVWFESNIKIVRDYHTKEVIEVQAASRDVTARILAEKNNQRGQLLANANRLTTMEEMASGMAHEINQPLAAIVNYTQGCVHHLEAINFDKNKVLAVMKKAVEQSERAGEIIHRLKNFFCKGKLYRQPESINTLIRESSNFLHHDLTSTNTKVKFALGKRLPAIEVDKIQLQQVILNLIQNSIEAMRDHNSKQRLITLSTLKENSNIIISISDSGPGISNAIINRVYAPFFTTKAYGTGMGLSICRSIIEAHGGQFSITANSANNNGRITIILPIEQITQGVKDERESYSICS